MALSSRILFLTNSENFPPDQHSDPSAECGIDYCNNGEECQRLLAEQVALGEPYSLLIVEGTSPAESELNQEAAALADILKTVPGPYCMIDVNTYEVLLANDAATHGSPLLPGTTCHQLLHNSDQPCSEECRPCPLQIVKHSGERAVVEHQYTRPDGSEVIYEVHAYPVFDDQGNVVRMFESSIDITARREEERTLQGRASEFREYLEKGPDAILVVGTDGLISRVNHQTEELFGYDRGELVGKELEILLPYRFRDGHQEKVQASFAGKKTRPLGFDRDLIGMHKDGSEFPVGVSVSRVETKGKLVFLAYIRDATVRKEREEAMRLAQEEAEAANRAKSEFLANMSHEIRTPMNGIIGMNRLLLDTELDEGQMECAEIVQGSADALLGLINDILDFSKIEANRLEFEQADFYLPDVINGVADTIAPTAFGKGLELLLDLDVSVVTGLCGDPTRLRQIMLNLCSNAVKFTEHGEVVIRARIRNTASGQRQLRFEVDDTGIGIDAEKQKTIFSRFSQADGSTTRKYGGTGLGLAISKQLAEMMDGEMDLSSQPGKGSKFWFTVQLPPAKSPCNHQTQARLKTESLRNKRVLVVDDNATNRLILVRLLERYGVIVHEAEDGLIGWDQLRTAKNDGAIYDVILLDMMMPAMDGAEVARIMRDENLTPDSLVMILSSADSNVSMNEMAALKIKRSMLKPLKINQLLRPLCEDLNPGARAEQEDSKNSDQKKSWEFPPLRVLVAEDNRVNQKLALRMLTNVGLDVTVVENGQLAVEAYQQHPFDLILMDLQMPVMGGIDATAKIRQHESLTGAHIPIIALTANAMQGDREMCIDGGMDGYVSKPIHREDLFALIQELTDQRPPLDKSA